MSGGGERRIREEGGLEQILQSLFERVKDIVRSDTIFGKPMEVKGGHIIPLSKIKIGFLAGSREHNSSGATGGAVSVEPIGVLVVLEDGRILFYSTTKPTSSIIEKVINLVPEVAEKIIPGIKERLERPKENADKSKGEQ